MESSLEPHPLHSVEQAGKKQGCPRRVEKSCDLESEKDSVRVELALVEGEPGVAMADSPSFCMRLWNSMVEKKGTPGATI